MAVDDTIIDRIYEAAFIPERYIAVLNQLAETVSCKQAFIFSTDGTHLTGWLGNSASEKTREVLLSEGWMERNPQAPRTIAHGEPRFITDHDIFSDEEIAASPYYSDFLDPCDAYWGTGSLIRGHPVTASSTPCTARARKDRWRAPMLKFSHPCVRIWRARH